MVVGGGFGWMFFTSGSIFVFCTPTLAEISSFQSECFKEQIESLSIDNINRVSKTLFSGRQTATSNLIRT